MEPIDDDPFEASSSPSSSSSSSSSCSNQKVEANDLLEECWFFDNLLIRKQRMLRCHSDPYCSSSSSNFGQEMSVKSSTISHDQHKVTQSNDGFGVRPNLARTPSLPVNLGREEEEVVLQVKQIEKSMSKLTRQKSHQKVLQQTPTKPQPCIGKTEEIQDRQSDDRRIKVNGQSMHRSLLRTPSLPSPRIGREDEKKQESAPPRHKGMTQSCSIPRCRPPRNTEGESNISTTDGGKEMRRRYLNKSQSRKSLTDLEYEEVQGFKDLGFTFDNKDQLAPSVVNILPGLQDKKGTEDLDLGKVRRPYLSEAWLVQSCAAPPTPKLGASRSAEDMKAQIKFWARAVASNVR